MEEQMAVEPHIERRRGHTTAGDEAKQPRQKGQARVYVQRDVQNQFSEQSNTRAQSHDMSKHLGEKWRVSATANPVIKVIAYGRW